MPIMAYLTPTFMNWFLIMLILGIAIFSTIESGSIVSLGIGMISVLFVMFKWFGSMGTPSQTIRFALVAALVLVVSLFSFLKKSEKVFDRL